MPSKDTVNRFIALVESGSTLKAIEEFYAEDATVQENQAPSRVGRERNLEHERKALTGIRSLQSSASLPFLIEDDLVVIRWVFNIEDNSGKTTRFEELAYQRWKDDKIASEQFFYDPDQLSSRQ